MIDVKTKTLKVIPDERGRVMEVLRSDEDLFKIPGVFGQVYITTVYPGVIKGWHMHRKQTDFVCCVSGMIKLSICPEEAVENNPMLYPEEGHAIRPHLVKEFILGDFSPQLVKIPPGLYHGWKCISEHEAIVLCVASEPYNYAQPDEYRLNPDERRIPYSWERRNG